MSKRVTKVISVNISAGVFPTFETAVKEADAIKIWLVRLCKKYGYAIKGTIGISMHNPSTGCITTKKNGGRGRPTTIFERRTSVMKPTVTEAHIHMVLYCNPASTIADKLSERINNKFHKRVTWVKNCEDYVDAAVNYLFKQSLKVRTVQYDADDILQDDEFGYCQAVEDSMSEYRNTIAFTKSETVQTSKIVETTGISDTSAEQKELPCNRQLNTPTDIKGSFNNHTSDNRDTINREDFSKNRKHIDTIHTLYRYFSSLLREKFAILKNICMSYILCMYIVAKDTGKGTFP